MARSKESLLESAIEIIKEYARSGGTSIAATLKSVYETLKVLEDDASEDR